MFSTLALPKMIHLIYMTMGKTHYYRIQKVNLAVSAGVLLSSVRVSATKTEAEF